MENKAFDVEALRRGHETHDPDLVASLYADDAESTTVDGRNPPSSPLTLRGKESITRALAKCHEPRGVTCEIQRVVLGPDSLAYQIACRHADGTRVLSSSVCELTGGKISRETIVQAWDS